jgi:glyoxylase-like metal-dependent hydrolase (beta-lactamase superfamily II)
VSWSTRGPGRAVRTPWGTGTRRGTASRRCPPRLTHLQAARAGGIEAAEQRFPNAAYHLHPADLRFFEEAHEDAYVAIRPAERLESLGVLRVADANHDIAPGVRLIHSPGHTPGHRSVLVTDGGEGLLLTGDLLHQPVQVTERMWFSEHDEDPLLGVASRRVLLLAGGNERLPGGGHAFRAPVRLDR